MESEFSKIMNLGAVGVALVALAAWHVRTVVAERRAYEKRVDERLVAEERFRDKYHAAIEKVGQALEALSHMLQRRRGGDA